jgi:hypothetical protein
MFLIKIQRIRTFINKTFKIHHKVGIKNKEKIYIMEEVNKLERAESH